MMPEDAPPPGTACIVIDCPQPATLYVEVADIATLDGDNSIAMCDDHAENWRDGNLG